MKFAAVGIVGIVVLAVGLALHGMVAPSRGDVVVDSTVVGVTLTQSTKGDTLYAQQVEFTDQATGDSYMTTANWSTSIQSVTGEIGRVAYPPGSPEEGRVVGSERQALGFLVVSGLGAAILLGSIVGFLRGQSATEKQVGASIARQGPNP